MELPYKWKLGDLKINIKFKALGYVCREMSKRISIEEDSARTSHALYTDVIENT